LQYSKKLQETTDEINSLRKENDKLNSDFSAKLVTMMKEKDEQEESH
jgi:hypothetical protein